MVDFKFYLNRQGVRGQRGEKGDKGFSPSITEKTNTKDEYVLHVQNETDDTSFDTPNLKEGLVPEDLGGTVVRYDRDNEQQYYGEIDSATEDKLGTVKLTGDDVVLNPTNETSVLTAQQAKDNYTPLSTANTLQANIEALQTKTDTTNTDLEELAGRVSMNSNDIKSQSYEISDIKTDVAELETTVNSLNTDITSTKSDVQKLKTDNTQNQTDIANLKTDKQDKLVAGDNITIKGNVISATGGGSGTGDVTAAGDNVFTGKNTFGEVINTTGTDIIQFGNLATWTDGMGGEFNTDKSIIKTTLNTDGFQVISEAGASYLPQVMDMHIKSQGNIILETNQNTVSDNMSFKNAPNKILDGNGNIILSQGNVAAGDNVTVEKTTKGIKISSIGGVTNITGTAPINVDANNNITVAIDDQTIKVVDGKLHANMDELGNEVNDLAGRVTANEADITTIQSDITDLTGQVESAAKIDDTAISTTSCYSSDKTVDYVNQQASALSTTIDAAKQDKLVAGDNISMVNNTDGTVTISSTASGGGESYTLPAATTDTLGGIKVGDGLAVTEDGTLSTTGGSDVPSNMMTTNTAQTITGTKTFQSATSQGNVIILEDRERSSLDPVSFGIIMDKPSTYTGNMTIYKTSDYSPYYGVLNGLTIGNISLSNTITSKGLIIPAMDSNGALETRYIGVGTVQAPCQMYIKFDADNSKIRISSYSATSGDTGLDIGNNTLTFKDGSGTTYDLLNPTISGYVTTEKYNELAARVAALEEKIDGGNA